MRLTIWLIDRDTQQARIKPLPDERPARVLAQEPCSIGPDIAEFEAALCLPHAVAS